MPSREAFLQPTVKVNGSELSRRYQACLEEVTVDQSLIHPDMFELVFRDMHGTLYHDQQESVLTAAHIDFGATVKIECVSGGGGGGVLIEGEVTALESRLDENGVVRVARGYDKAHRLHMGRTTRTFKNSKVSDVVSQVASDAGLRTGNIDDSGAVLDVISQHNQSDWEFLNAQATELGFEVFVQEGKLYFQKPDTSSQAPSPGNFDSSDPNALVWGDDLLSFRPRMSAAQQVGNIEVRSWDPKEKKVITTTVGAAADHASLQVTPSALAGKFGGRTFSHVSTPHRVQGQVEKEAGALAQELGSSFAEAEGMCVGTPVVCAGAKISIGQVGGKHDGKYTVTTARHCWDPYEGYVTHFTISGRQDRSLVGLASGAVGPQPDFHGLVVAQVTDNNDPDSLGRVKLKFPWLSDSYETDWVRTVHTGAGPNSGTVWMPEANDEVLVGFEHGDMRQPYVLGGLFNGKDKPMLGDGLFDNGKVKRRGSISRKGHKLLFFDDDSKSGFCIHSSDGKLKLSMNETNKAVKITTDKHTITIDDNANKITITSGGDMEVAAGSSGTLTLSGQTVKIQASGGNVEVTGTQIKLN